METFSSFKAYFCGFIIFTSSVHKSLCFISLNIVNNICITCRNVQERNDWLDALNSAIEDYRSRKATFVSLDHVSSPLHSRYKLGDVAPVWIPDTRVTMCQSCSTEFSLVHRRHHCRACGKVVCAPCSSNKAPLRYRQFESSRVCDACYDGVEKSKNFKHKKLIC